MDSKLKVSRVWIVLTRKEQKGKQKVRNIAGMIDDEYWYVSETEVTEPWVRKILYIWLTLIWFFIILMWTVSSDTYQEVAFESPDIGRDHRLWNQSYP